MSLVTLHQGYLLMTEPAASEIHYDVYLLRLWHDDVQGPLRASAQDIRDGTFHHFATFEALVAFLAQRSGQEQER